jgi:hypothetical protein
MPGSNPNKPRIRIAGGAGYAGDRWEPALECVEQGGVDYLVFETLAERTIALAQLEKLAMPERGYNPQLEARLGAVLPAAIERGVRIVTNMGAANPLAAGQVVLDIVRRAGLAPVKVAVVLGDDVLDAVRTLDAPLMEATGTLDALRPHLVSANAYLGADVVAQALATGADVVVTGRTADPSLFVGCMLHGLGWSYDDYGRLGQATLVGHLLECAGQVTGGYFADPGYKDVPDLGRLGFPIGEVDVDGCASITKVAGSGGLVTPATCKEQLLYEVRDPASYYTPDCVADFSQVTVAEREPDCVEVRGALARPRTPTYKVSVGYRAGYIGDGQVAYAGPGAADRARLAAQIVRERIALRGLPVEELRVDLIGISALHGAAAQVCGDPYEVRVRVAGRTQRREDAYALGMEVQTLLTNGPYGGAGDFVQVREVVGVRSILLDRDRVRPEVRVLAA